ncbi:hypothetical protein NQZ68_021875 [Dissostichus eleginoides]|nr:hypothetical protein NQZ68_021875 [Dissostichus eleginoides]
MDQGAFTRRLSGEQVLPSTWTRGPSQGVSLGNRSSPPPGRGGLHKASLWGTGLPRTMIRFLWVLQSGFTSCCPFLEVPRLTHKMVQSVDSTSDPNPGVTEEQDSHAVHMSLRGFRVSGSGSRVQDPEFRVQSSGSRAQTSWTYLWTGNKDSLPVDRVYL